MKAVIGQGQGGARRTFLDEIIGREIRIEQERLFIGWDHTFLAGAACV
jgi:hypothetical protein